MLYVVFILLGMIVIASIYTYKRKEEQKRIDDENKRRVEQRKQQEKYNKYKTYIKENSIALQKLRMLNQKYAFYPNENFDQQYSYDNQQYFDTISCKDYLIYQLQYEQTKIQQQLGKIAFNKKHHQAYTNELQTIEVVGECIAPDPLLDEAFLLSVEKEYFQSEIQNPPLSFHIGVTLVLTNIKGEYITKKTEVFSQEQIRKWIEQIGDRTGNFYNNREIWDAICRVERGKVSNKMRFSIYERDGYRCRCCHRQFEEPELEIDHIKPIAEGGKSVEENLQTLCRDCNQIKGKRHIRY